MGGSVDHLSPGPVEQAPQRGVDPVRRLLPLEDPDVVRGLSDDVLCQMESMAGVEVEREESQQHTCVLIGAFLAVSGSMTGEM